jgi:hypothetical protein
MNRPVDKAANWCALYNYSAITSVSDPATIYTYVVLKE